MKSALLRPFLGVLLAACMLSFPSAPAASAEKPESEGWVPLFNGKNLDGWYSYLDSSGKNKDPNGVFKVENGMIHILDVPMSGGKSDNGYLATNSGILQRSHSCRIQVGYETRFGGQKK